jgi:O-methyltransferase domain/Dimerisation domain
VPSSSHFDHVVEASAAETLTEMIMAYRLSQLIHIAARLGIADLLKGGARSCDELASRTGVHPPALCRVLRALASNGIFAETEEGVFELTPLAAPLQTGVPGSLRGLAVMQAEELRWRAWGELLYSVKTGKSAVEHIYGMTNWEWYAQNPDAFERFSEGMAELTRRAIPALVTAYGFSAHQRIVDVGGGRGELIAAILTQSPHLRGILVELPALIDDARTVLEAAGVAARCELVAGDYFESVPSGGDVYILKSIVHGMDDAKAARVLRNCREAMTSGGRLLVIQAIVPSGNAPARIKVSDILHLVSGGGQERTEAQYRTLFDASGFSLVKIHPASSSFSILEGVRS